MSLYPKCTQEELLETYKKGVKGCAIMAICFFVFLMIKQLLSM